MSKDYTITIGNHENAEELRRALEDAGCDTASTGEILSKIVVASEAAQLDLAVVTVEELGLGERVTRKQVYARARDRGLGLCPAEAGPQLWLQRKDQIDEPQLYIGMEPMTTSSGDLEVFQVGRYGPSVFLSTWDGAPDGVFYAAQSWLFVRGSSEAEDSGARRSLLARMLGR